MKADSESNPVLLPPALLAEVEAAAIEEHRPVADVSRDVIERGLEERRWQRTLAYGRERAAALGLTEADIPRLIAESRREHRQGQSSP